MLPNGRNSVSVLALLLGAITAPNCHAQAAPAPVSGQDAVETVVVTGSTSRRTVLNASVAVTPITDEQIALKAPRSTDEVLEMVPGIFVEATAGPVSNNYSVRGLPGGGQNFVRLIEDGMAPIYTGLNDDEVFQNNIGIERVEALTGGSSGILTPNAAGASINFISRKLNYDQAGGIFRASYASYGDVRGDGWFSGPIKALGDDVAFSISGFYDDTKGTRASRFHYPTWHLKTQLEKSFADGGYVRATYRHWDEHDPYYADQPYAFKNGKISSVPGLDSQFGSIIGPDFGNITVPNSCLANGQCFRNFSISKGIHGVGDLYRLDFQKPLGKEFSLFARARYTQTNWDFNGVFAGSGTGNAGLAPARVYLTNNSNSPIQSLLQQGAAAFPTAVQFGIRRLNTGQVIAASNTAALNALNGNGLLEQTVLNRQLIKMRDFGSDFGVKWETDGAGWTNSLTLGAMYYSTHQDNDQSGTATLINDVVNQSNIYDIVALDGASNVVGTLSNNGLIGYGTWGNGMSYWQQTSTSVYVNNEFAYAEKLHVDFGLRYEHERRTGAGGNSSPLPIPAGVGGLLQVNPNAFNGTYTPFTGAESPLHWTVGVNYVIDPSLSVYGRYEHAYQTQGSNNKPTGITLWETGVTYAGFGMVGTLRLFRTEFNNQSWGGGVVPTNPDLNQGFFADSITNGLNADLTYRPEFDALKAFSVQLQGTYQKSEFSNVRTGVINVGGQNISQQINDFYNGKTPQRTPDVMFAIQPTYDLPGDLGTIYARYKYIGRIFADNGDQVELPAYGVVSVGVNYNISERMTLNVSGDNLTNEIGLTEGNPRQGFTQQIVNGYFYGRGIIGPNVQASLTYKY
ncbi:outer membrane receptor protein involved in Fe transport [Rhizomicrobium palustre]|uniref:Outer membrane receptor protein involved in Fe transport n=1 Tax=Rhizomicrobium palustre TaxID=189966 RepID=A0A846MYH4_9PROT|nr:TonB-dependent receptor [Rhizomicrobium palustre]NIK88017.1 outer membrane receptor protein involved in Fe transport [Rhizomicrobium palustre]